jgi:hypothetical protein
MPRQYSSPTNICERTQTLAGGTARNEQDSLFVQLPITAARTMSENLCGLFADSARTSSQSGFRS